MTDSKHAHLSTPDNDVYHPTDSFVMTADGIRLRPESPSDMALDDRRRTIAEIRRLNPTAGLAFLAEFQTASLRDYLEHLKHRRHKHVRLAGWLQRRNSNLAAMRRAA